MDQQNITRRRAIGAATLAALAATVAGLAAPAPAEAGLVPPAAPDVPLIDQSEVLVLQLEGILLGLDQYARIDVLVELDRLGDIAKAADPHALAAELPRNTGANRSSVVMPWGDE